MYTQVEARLHEVIRGEGLLGAAAAHLTHAQAKRARPRLVLGFAKLIDSASQSEHLVDAAAAVELIHTASLLHDDVVDEAATRRDVASANARFGNSAAVLAGDFVLARSLALLAWDARAVTAAIDVVARMSAAAVREVEVRGKRISIDDAVRIAEGKTAALFGLCGTLAGLACGASAAGDALREAGEAFGVAFQISDDIDDVDADAREGYATVPLMTSRAEASALVDMHLARARNALAPFAGTEAHREVLTFAAAIGRTVGRGAA